MFCGNCGNMLNDNDSFCKKCGEPVIRTEDGVPPYQPPYDRGSRPGPAPYDGDYRTRVVLNFPEPETNDIYYSGADHRPQKTGEAKKSSAGTRMIIVAIVVVGILLAAAAAMMVYLLMNDNKDSGPADNSAAAVEETAAATQAAVTEAPPTETPTAAPTAAPTEFISPDNVKSAAYFSSAYASSVLPDEKGHSYKASNVLVNDSSCWVENASGYGEGEWITLELPEVQRLYGLSIINGYVGSEWQYSHNSKISEIRIEFPNGQYFEEKLEVYPTAERSTVQCLVFEEPVYTDRVKIIIKSTVKGECADTCLTYVAPY